MRSALPAETTRGCSGSLRSTTTTPLSDPYVKPADRKIFTMSSDGSATAGQAFTVANKGKQVLSKDLTVRGGDLSFKSRKNLTGALVITVKVTGPGGTATDTRTVRITR